MMKRAVVSIASVAAALVTQASPCEPENRCTVEGAIPVVNLLYREDYNTLHGGERKSFDLVTIGDSITCNWSVRDADGYCALSARGQGGVLNLGIGGDRTEHVLWRVGAGGCLENFTTKYFTLLIGTNNSFQKDPCDRPEEIALGIRRILSALTTAHPEAKVLLMPILPYAQTTDLRGPVRFANNEAVNDIIIRYADNRRIFWLDLRGALMNADGSFKEELWSAGTAPGSDGVGHYLHPSGRAYKEVFDPAVRKAMAKYGAVAAGTAQEADPSLGIISVALDGAKSKAEVMLSGVYLGTDAAAAAATSCSVAYRLDGGAWTEALAKETRTRFSFEIPAVAVGRHACEIKVTTDKGKTVATTAEFTMCDPWTAERLASGSASIRTNGTLVCAYAQRSCTVNGVPFEELKVTENEHIRWGLVLGFNSRHPVPADAERGGYSDLLGAGWWLPSSTRECPLLVKDLTPGATYLVQLVAHRPAFNDGRIWVDGTQKETTCVKAGGEGWPFGGTLVGTFTADATGTKKLVFKSDGGWALNAVQVRKLRDK